MAHVNQRGSGSVSQLWRCLKHPWGSRGRCFHGHVPRPPKFEFSPAEGFQNWAVCHMWAKYLEELILNRMGRNPLVQASSTWRLDVGFTQVLGLLNKQKYSMILWFCDMNLSWPRYLSWFEISSYLSFLATKAACIMHVTVVEVRQMTPIIDGYFSAFFPWVFLIRKKNT